MWNLKYDTNELICETERLMDIENRLVIARGGGGVVSRDGKDGLGVGD